MAGVTGKRPKVVLVKKDTVDQAGAFLDALPEKPREAFSLRAAVERLREPIRAALIKGYSYDEVAAMLAAQGINISASTLKNYAPSGARQSSKDEAATGKGRKSSKLGEETTIAAQAEPQLDAASMQLESVSESKSKDGVSLVDSTETPEAAPQSQKRRTRTTTAKTTPSTRTKTAAKTKPSGSQQTAATVAKKPATTKSRGRSATKK